MFDDNTNTPTNLPTEKEPEDMFAKVEPSTRPNDMSPVSTSAPTSTVIRQEEGIEMKGPLIASRKVIIIVGIVVAIAAVGGIAWGFFRFLNTATAPVANVENLGASEQQNSQIPSLPEPQPSPENFADTNFESMVLVPEEVDPSVTPPPAVDTDSDGLTDDMEVSYGTDPLKADSDNDNLMDGEEVQTYQTDPLNFDTDGDGFSDGQEVKNGYNPKGSGKLFEIPSQ